MVDGERTVTNFIDALRNYVARASRRKDAAVLQAMTAHLMGEKMHGFALRVIRDNVLGRGPLHAVVRLNYFLISDLVIIDALFHRLDNEVVECAARSYGKKRVMGVVLILLQNFNRFGRVEAMMKEKEGLESYSIGDARDRWTPRNVKNFVGELAGYVGGVIPEKESRRLFIAVGIEPTVDSVVNHTMEFQDAFPVVDGLTAGDESAVDAAIDFIHGKCPSLASFLSQRFGRGAIPCDIEFRSACTANDALHALHDNGDFVVRGKSDVENFRRHLADSRHFAVEIYVASDPEKVDEYVSMAVFGFRKKVVFAFPRLFPDAVRDIGRALDADPKPVLTYRWSRRAYLVEKTFKWKPGNVIDALDVAHRHDMTATLDAMTEKVVGGAFCRRASDFSGNVVPSAAALEHRAMRITLIYEFVVRMERLRASGGRSDRGRRWVADPQPAGSMAREERGRQDRRENDRRDRRPDSHHGGASRR